ncbi:septal ring lytic transglycosylase RlpA family protein [Sulfurovum sp.]|uniref:septal ring lytic transglycosylase RlpA family protein n=1 Tax=Sulfurovum sp. TaxID=1969726 RepID=UPI0028681119|nr:septal ring lytic transglycosylase RlpA family protein [Sulfurovum sp.]
MHKYMQWLIALSSLSLVFVGCGNSAIPNTEQTVVKDCLQITHDEKNYRVDKKVKAQIGNASYYANCMKGRRTASGEICNLRLYTAAHRTWPFGTIIRVTMLQNGKSVIVKVNDRGPFTRSRVVDLSTAAAQKIGLIGPGIAKVKIEKLENLH